MGIPVFVEGAEEGPWLLPLPGVCEFLQGCHCHGWWTQFLLPCLRLAIWPPLDQGPESILHCMTWEQQLLTGPHSHLTLGRLRCASGVACERLGHKQMTC